MSLLADTVMLARMEDDAVAIMAIGGGIAVALVSIIAGAIRTTLKTRAREQTKREIAAYIAEGSMKPEDGERILRADMRAWERGDGAWKCGC